VRPQPGQRDRIVWPAPQDVRRHRQQRVQVERAGPAVADPGQRQVVPPCRGVAQLAGEDAGAGQAEAALLRWRRRHQPEKHVLGDARRVELPGDDPGAGRRGLERRERRRDPVTKS
jgi:hypothetical protein